MWTNIHSSIILNSQIVQTTQTSINLWMINKMWNIQTMEYCFQSPSCVWLFATPRTAAHQASLSLTISRSLPKFMSIALVMHSSHLILWRPLLLQPSIFSSIRDFSNESAVHIRYQNTGASASSSVFPTSQFSSVAQLCPTLCEPMNHSTPGLPVQRIFRVDFP